MTGLRTRRTRVRGLLVSAMVALMLAATSGCGLLDNGAYDLPLPGGADVGEQPAEIEVHFASVEGLVPKSQVKLNNVPVGRVEQIEIDETDWTAVVTLTVQNDLSLPVGVQARVRRSSLLGEWYVELVRPNGAADAGAPGEDIPEVIDMERTGSSTGVEEVLGALSLLLNNGGLPQLNTILVELNAAMAGNEPQLRALLEDVNEFAGTLNDNRDAIVDALDGLARLSKVLRNNNRQIATTLDQIPQGLKVLADQRPQLTRMLRAMDRLSRVTVDVVDRSKDDLVADLKLLRPTLVALTEAGQDLPKALEILATFPFTPGALDTALGDYVNLNAKIDLDLDAVLATLLAGLPNATESIPDPLRDLLEGLTPKEPNAKAPQPLLPDLPELLNGVTTEVPDTLEELLGGLLGGTP